MLMGEKMENRHEKVQFVTRTCVLVCLQLQLSYTSTFLTFILDKAQRAGGIKQRGLNRVCWSEGTLWCSGFYGSVTNTVPWYQIILFLPSN